MKGLPRRGVPTLVCAVLMLCLAATVWASPSGEAAAGKEEAVVFRTITHIGMPIDQETVVETTLEKILTDKLGFVVDFQPIDTLFEGYLEKLNVMIAGDDTPDMWYWYSLQRNLVEQGAVAALDMDRIKSYMPTIYQHIEQQNSRTDRDLWSFQSRDGTVYGVPAGLSRWTPSPRGTAARMDLLEKAGISSMPATIDEWEKAFGAVKSELGLYGMSAFGVKSNRFFSIIFGAYGALPFIWTERDGKLVYGAVLPEMKEALETLNRWYEEGYIVKDWATLDQLTSWDMVINGRAVLFDDWPYSKLYTGPEAAVENPPLLARKLDPDAELVLITPPSGPGGMRGNLGLSGSTAASYFGSHLEGTEKLDKIFQIKEAIFADEDLYTLAVYGREGVDWEWQEDHAQRIGDATTREGQARIGVTKYFLGLHTNYDYYSKYDVSARYSAFLDEVMASSDNWYVDAARTKGLTVTDENVIQASADLSGWVIAEYAKFINGLRPLSKFDEFVREFYEEHGGRLLEEAMNEANRAHQSR